MVVESAEHLHASKVLNTFDFDDISISVNCILFKGFIRILELY